MPCSDIGPCVPLALVGPGCIIIPSYYGLFIESQPIAAKKDKTADPRYAKNKTAAIGPDKSASKIGIGSVELQCDVGSGLGELCPMTADESDEPEAGFVRSIGI
jgi:hypothetical protein